jgi:diguanylate cyclase (GGDEF)-like protein
VTYPSLSRLIIPALLLVVAWSILPGFKQATAAYKELIVQLPYLVLAIASALAVQFNRSKFIAAAMVLAITYWLIQCCLQVSLQQPAAFFAFTALSLFAPLTLVLIGLLPELGVFNRYGFCLLLVPLIFLIAGMMLQQFDVSIFQSNSGLQAKPFSGYVLSLGSSIVFLVAALTLTVLLCLRDSETDVAILFCLIFLFCTLTFLHQSLISVLMFSAAGICLLHCLIKSSHDMAYRDELTGLRGRRALNERLRGLGRHYVVAMVDVDHFKQFNDQYGHDVGDDVLKVIAKHINRVGGGGTAYRYGGEEFSLVFAGKNIEACQPHLENVRESIENYSILLRDQHSRPDSSKEGKKQRGHNRKAKSVSVTVSIGVAERDEEQSKAEEVLKMADKALYKAKKNGRNCLARN